MNRIRAGRLMISGLIALLVFVAVELIIEQIFGRRIFVGITEKWVNASAIQDWTAANYILNVLIVLATCIMIMWLYAALRPMFGVGTKTALITSMFVLTFVSAYALNETNLGLFPFQITMIQLFYWVVELPAAVVAGAYYYEKG